VIRRFSSRHGRLGHVFLKEQLAGAQSYLRIAGYFRSSLFELVNEELEGIDTIRIVCNSDLDPRDIGIARSVEQQAMALKEKFNESSPAADAVFHRERYQRLHAALVRGNLKVRVVGRTTAPFLHGKAGVIQKRDGSRTSFLGSLNETREGWSDNYELMWEDDAPDAVQWVTEEFEYLWAQGVPLPDAVIEEIDRLANRKEFRRIEDCAPPNLPAASMVEAPIYRRGEKLMPWQQAFVSMFLEHRETYGSARILLADEVGVGKTLSLATSAVLASLLGDGPTLILCPATLAQQWQVELLDKLGVPSAVWTRNKAWLDPWGHEIPARGPEDVARCPLQIGIVSTGLITQRTPEREHLLAKSFGMLILDEAHRARRTGGVGNKAGEPNNLLDFMQSAAKKARHVLLGTATPVQTDVKELWDLLDVLGQGADFVLGRKSGSLWRAPDRTLAVLTGKRLVVDDGERWDLLRNPLPPGREEALFDHIRSDLGVAKDAFFTSKATVELDAFTRAELQDKLSSTSGLPFFRQHNPVVRHTVLRTRADLEERGLLPKIAVDKHPGREDAKPFFKGLALRTNPDIDEAYQAAEEFTSELGKRVKSAGFLKGMLLQRICSSLASGLSTARKLLDRATLEDDEGIPPDGPLSKLTDAEKRILKEIIAALERKPADPKLDAVCHYLFEMPLWLDLGCIVFSQYYDTAWWVAESLAKKRPEEPVALYAGAGRSGIFRGEEWVSVERDDIKTAVKERKLRLLVATDAACEGLNLQTLGTLINVDLPWNPSRLEQRLGRIKRFGQSRSSVDMLNLVYAGTRDEVVYQRLSDRMKDRFDLFGALPDVIEDDWIDDVETLDAKLAEFIQKRKTATAFELRYGETIDPKGDPWERCSEVLSRRDVVERLSRAW